MKKHFQLKRKGSTSKYLRVLILHWKIYKLSLMKKKVERRSLESEDFENRAVVLKALG